MNDRDRFRAATNESALTAALTPHIEAAWGMPVRVEAVEVPRVFPRGTDFTLQYRVFVRRPASGLEVLLLGGRLLGARSEWPRWASSPTGHVLRDDDARFAVPIFPFDPHLGALADWADGTRAASTLARVLGADAADVQPHVLAYRLEKRCVVRLDRTGDTGVIVKVCGRRRADRCVETLGAIAAAGGGDGVPHVLATDAESGAYVMEMAPGVSLHEMTGDESFRAGCRAAGEMLRVLHRVPAGALPALGTARAFERLAALVVALQPLDAELAAGISDARRELAAAVPAAPPRAGLVHGDFYDKQVLYAPQRTTVIDWDSAHAGDAAEDHGNFVAHLSLRTLQMSNLGDSLAAGRSAFETAYTPPDAAFLRRSRWWESATLARLAGIYALRPHWHHLAGTLLQRSRQLLRTAARAAAVCLIAGLGLAGGARAQSAGTGAPEYMRAAPTVGRAFEIEVVADGKGNWRATSIIALAEPRKPSLRGGIDAIDAGKRTLVVMGRTVQVTDKTVSEDPDSVQTKFANLQPGARVEVTCTVDSSGNWTAKRIRTHNVKASNKIKGTLTAAAVDGAPPDTIEIHGLRVVLDITTDVPNRLGGVDLEWLLFEGLTFDDTRRFTGGIAFLGGRAHAAGQVSGDSRARDELDLSASFVSDEDVAQSEFRLQTVGLWTPHLKTFAQARLRKGFVLHSDFDRGSTPAQLQLTQAYGLLKTAGPRGVALQAGRQDFDEPREWIFDEYQDAVRVHAWGRKRLVGEAAYLHAVRPLKANLATWTDWYASARWYFHRRSFAAVWLLRRTDTSARNREPVWLGARYLGRLRGGIVKPWLDTALMRGTDRGQTLRAWALDAGATVQRANVRFQPAVTVGYAVGSGDDSGRDGVDGNFRQTGYQDNYARLGGAAPLYYYGALLDPELSNVRIWTAGFSVRPLPAASVDVVYHRYRQDIADGSLRSNNLIDPPARPGGGDPDLGWGVDWVAASPPFWQRVRVKWTSTMFEPGAAFGPRQERAWMHRLEMTAAY